jgi:hypothetical protein
MDVSRLLRVRLDLAAQAVDRMVDRAGDPWIRVLPDVAEELIATDNTPWALGQVFEEAELPVREMHFLHTAPRDAREKVDPNVT